MYNLNSDSKAAKFYEWLWNTDVKDFKSMCPYFWAYVITILILPIILIIKGIYRCLPKENKVFDAIDYVVDSKLGKATVNFADDIAKHTNFWTKVGTFLKWVFFILLGALVLAGFVGLTMVVIHYTIETLAFIGGICLSTGFVYLIVHLFTEYNIGKNISSFFIVVWSPFKLFGNMIHNLYKKSCPIINWK